MKKRLLVSLLWFYSAWYGGALVAHFAGLPGAIGPLLGIAAAALCVADPGGVIWSPPWRRERVATSRSGAASGAAAQPSSGGSPGR